MYLRVVVVLKELLKDIFRQLQKLIDVLKQRSMIVGRYQVLSLLQLRHEALNPEIHCTNKMLLAIDQLYEISPP